MLRSLALILVMLASTTFAQAPAPEVAVPPALKDWRPWVLKDLDYRACPFLAGHSPNGAADFVCAWPGRLTLASGADGATFSVHWRVEAPGWVPLPGDVEHWPQQVSVNAQRQPVLAVGDEPALWLAPGSYEVSGRIPWHERPQTLAVPTSIGLIALSVDGKAIAPIQRDGAQITLGRSATTAPEADNIEIRIYRKLTDDVPAHLTTQLLIGVSGQAREEILGPVLPEGFAPLSLEGEWPTRLDGDGRLHVQVQPGSETLTLEARALAPLQSLTVHVPAAPWPKQEIWSYEAQPHLRMTAVSSTVQVDPRQAEVPQDWQTLPAFALADGAKLALEERSRGLAADEANRLTLRRNLWLDFSGAGWYARDHVRGSMAQGWRFDVAAPFTLEQATARNSHYDNAGEPLLITRGAKDELSGVEWRTPNVDLAADVRVAAPASMPVAGWQQTFVAYLLLGYQEADRPLWTLLAALGLALITRALPAGKLERAVQTLRRIALVVLVLWTLPFVAEQVRDALYPQLEEGGYATALVGNYRGALGGAMAPQNAPAGPSPSRARCPRWRRRQNPKRTRASRWKPSSSPVRIFTAPMSSITTARPPLCRPAPACRAGISAARRGCPGAGRCWPRRACIC
jgi:hypothetical protein